MLNSLIDFNNNPYVKIAPFSELEIKAATDLLKKGLGDTLYINERFENDFGNYMGVNYTLACCNGTAAMLEAMWACGVGNNTEVIAPAMTFWASAYPAYTLGAKVKYVDINPETLCIDPTLIEESINEKTRAIVVVHLYGHPCDMDSIIKIAKKNNLYVIEDFSHAHGTRYKNKICGTIGDIGIGSCMGEKPFSLPEGGIICTNNVELYERCCSFGHYRYLGTNENGERKNGKVKNQALLRFAGAPIGGIKNRMNPISAAIGIERLRTFEDQIKETNYSINYFLNLIEENGSYIGHRTQETGSSMGGWYEPKVFVKDVSAENLTEKIRNLGYGSYSGHKYYNLANHLLGSRDFIREKISNEEIETLYEEINPKMFENIEKTDNSIISIPRFSKFNSKVIEDYAALYIQALKS